MKVLAHWLLALLILCLASPVSAQPSGTFQSADALQAFAKRGAELPEILRSKADPINFFAPSFVAAVPISQVEQTAKQLIVQHGPVMSAAETKLVTQSSGYVDVVYERSIVRFNLTIDPVAPHQVIGLIVASIKPRGDSADKLLTDLRALSGQSALLVQRLDNPADRPLFAYNETLPLAVGSGFKLWVLAEAARATAARERSWSDVVPLGKPSLPSGISQKWPKGGPITLHTLATLMISQSDNSATDTLLHALGRNRVDAMFSNIIRSDRARTLPILSTLEAFTLKTDSYAMLRARYVAADIEGRRALLNQLAPRLSAEAIDLSQFGGKPRSIDSIEWFASPVEMAATLDHLRNKGGTEALAILAVNPGIAPADAEDYAYVGYKGGSEIGVMAMNLLVKTKDGRWYAVTGAWNNKAAAVDQNKFVALVTRAVALIKP
jgi:beta-lactamase class A